MKRIKTIFYIVLAIYVFVPIWVSSSYYVFGLSYGISMPDEHQNFVGYWRSVDLHHKEYIHLHIKQNRSVSYEKPANVINAWRPGVVKEVTSNRITLCDPGRFFPLSTLWGHKISNERTSDILEINKLPFEKDNETYMVINDVKYILREQ